MDVFGIKEQHCKICDKIIIPTHDWIYRRTIWVNKGKNAKVVWYCSWSHYKQDEDLDTSRKYKKNKGE